MEWVEVFGFMVGRLDPHCSEDVWGVEGVITGIMVGRDPDPELY